MSNDIFNMFKEFNIVIILIEKIFKRSEVEMQFVIGKEEKGRER